MYNKIYTKKKQTRKECCCTLALLYNEESVFGRLFLFFKNYFVSVSTPTAETLIFFVISMLVMESANSVRSLYKHFFCKITCKSLTAVYHALSYAKVDCYRLMNVSASLAIKTIPYKLSLQPVFICIDDTMVEKAGTKFDGVSKLFDHAAHNGSNYLNGHCFVSLTLCVPVWKDGKSQISYLPVSLGYRMWNKDKTKLQLAAGMVRQIMPELSSKRNVIILCDSWYAKSDIFDLTSEYDNLDIVCNIRHDTVLYDLPPEKTGKRGRPAIRGERLSLDDFALTDEKIGDYYISAREVVTNYLKGEPMQAFVTSTEKSGGSRRLFLSTVCVARLQIFCAWQETYPLNHTGSDWMDYIPLFCYSFRWNIEVGYYEQKTFWSLCKYMVRSHHGIEMMVNLINIAYSGMKLIPYFDESFAKYKYESPQEFRFELSEQIREQVFYATLVDSVETGIKSKIVDTWLKIKASTASSGY